MILKSDRLAALLDAGARANAQDPFVVTPTPNIRRLRRSGSASIDLRLGTWFVSLRQARMTHMSVDRGRQFTTQLTKTHYVPFGDEYVLHPASFVLGATLEWIRLPTNLAAYVVGRSSWGRRGLIIATATGVHPGFKGCLTLELSNVGEIPIGIRPGMTICQLFVHGLASLEKHVDASGFVGLRKPSLGTIKLDAVARKLCRAD